MDLKELDGKDPSKHWYYRTKVLPFASNALNFSPNATRVIDIGAGSGFFAKYLCDLFPNSTALCVDPNYGSNSLGQHGNIQYVLNASGKKADIYVFADVLEHVEDDIQLLRCYTDQCEKGSLILISVPAFMILWSQHDVYLEHYRRYTLEQVEEVVKIAGLKIVQSKYLFPSLFPVALIKRKLSRNKSSSDMADMPKLANFLLTRYFHFENRFFSNKHFGLSVFVAAIKE